MVAAVPDGSLGPLDLARLSTDPRTVLLVDPFLRVQWMNRSIPGFFPPRSLLLAIDGPQRWFYAAWMARALRSPVALEHEYECPTPEHRRRWRMRAYPVEGQGLLLVHSLVAERPHGTPGGDDLASYIDSDGIIHVCGHCRCTRRPDGSGVYDWVPVILEPPAEDELVSHGLCPACAAYYFPDPGRGAGEPSPVP